ncbi:hypothetical protein Ahy_A09g046311 [Arachis hypogaea]|uniref:Uncharacterized protein n=1 Tax=Arachis hypogaea TaxID=3818 RepID=A0A445BPF1_ARAHY|nr:hypothetical protein Ahy_A09g046311 [Arachis hypogaea]
MTMEQNPIPKLSKPVKEKRVDKGVEIVVMEMMREMQCQQYEAFKISNPGMTATTLRRFNLVHIPYSSFDTRETNKRAKAPPGKPPNDGKVSNGEDDVGAGHVRFEQVFGSSKTSIDCVAVWILYPHSFLCFLMNLISWNCRGTGGRRFPVLIRDLKKKYDIGMLILLKTHISGDRRRDIRNKLSFDSSYYEEARGHSGVAIKNSSTSFIMTVYGSPQKINNNLWDNLRALSAGLLVGPGPLHWARHIDDESNIKFWDHQRVPNKGRLEQAANQDKEKLIEKLPKEIVKEILALSPFALKEAHNLI